MEALIRNAIGDSANEVKVQAAKIIGEVAPNLLAEFSTLLKRPQSAAVAFESFGGFLRVHGFGALFEPLCAGAEHAPAAAVTALFSVMPGLSQEERGRVWPLIDRLGSERGLGAEVARFVEFYDNKREFVKFIDPGSVVGWRRRIVLLNRAIELVGHIGRDFVPLAVKFATDETGIVRVASVGLWIALISEDSSLAGSDGLLRLLAQNWQARLVAAKIVAAFGPREELRDVAYSLARDRVEPVRSCVAAAIRHTDWFDELFPHGGGHIDV
jgi:hypothetical protein